MESTPKKFREVIQIIRSAGNIILRQSTREFEKNPSRFALIPYQD